MDIASIIDDGNTLLEREAVQGVDETDMLAKVVAITSASPAPTVLGVGGGSAAGMGGSECIYSFASKVRPIYM